MKMSKTKICPERWLIASFGEIYKYKHFEKSFNEDRETILKNKRNLVGSNANEFLTISARITTKYRYRREGSNRQPKNTFYYNVNNDLPILLLCIK